MLLIVAVGSNRTTTTIRALRKEQNTYYVGILESHVNGPENRFAVGTLSVHAVVQSYDSIFSKDKQGKGNTKDLEAPRASQRNYQRLYRPQKMGASG